MRFARNIHARRGEAIHSGIQGAVGQPFQDRGLAFGGEEETDDLIEAGKISCGGPVEEGTKAVVVVCNLTFEDEELSLARRSLNDQAPEAVLLRGDVTRCLFGTET